MNPRRSTRRDALQGLADLKAQMGEVPGLDEAERLLVERN